ncbi:T9SS type A sorting domain-containing protein [Mucilaginibacter sp. KACC 22063]|uniref:T9SS type A sorting domain-containing protein n=1 Tax=Mucilaginibacter sp. KACC 22063 TaxID=3025666 RepID=UPI00236662B9|nr:T9SS type A sorting domain-containing protein [Mucilaginibacter sp. KACC 22063]WDF53492.1 T9SS type A sorting domain-containing protein [Mucilaginibacter sp. KACC 22063]
MERLVMRGLLFCFLFITLCLPALAQTEQRLKFVSAIPSEDTGQDYSPWLNDNLDSLVENVWLNNFKYVDVTLKLQSHSKITKLSFYDYTGVFIDKPDSIYIVNGNTKTFVGLFTGETYMTFVDLVLPYAMEADAVMIHKFSNNIPMKVFAYGYPGTLVQNIPPPLSTAQKDTTIVKIPIEPSRWYQLNNVSDGLGGLFDSITNINVNTGWGKMFNNYDAYYPVADGEIINLYKVKFYDGEGSLGPYPLTLSVVNSKGERKEIARFTGSRYNTWVGPYPDKDAQGEDLFKLDSVITDVKYLVLNCWYMFPTEMELYGTYKAGTAPTPAIKKNYPLKNYFGVNAFEWDFEDPNNPMVIDENRMKAVKSFTQVRHYMDWQKLESSEGSYTFSPVHSGGWSYDAIYQRCKQDGIEILADLKTLPDWMLATYPEDQRDAENVPIKYGKDFSDPMSYIDQAKVAYQFAARYGSNAAVDSTNLSVNATPRWTNDPVNVVKRGLNLVKYIECDNERDKWWKGRKAYQTSYEYAANLSAFYDGNKNTMGPGVGVKNADPDIMVVMGGLAAADPQYVQGMVDWCKQHRGFKANGEVNLCWDIINYHLYANDAQNSQAGGATRGAAPEVSNTSQVADKFVQMAHRYAGDMPVWVTEVGYDINQGSPYKAIAIGEKTALQTQADWILRSSLQYAKSGIARVFFYEMYDDNALSPVQFASSGLINANHTRKPAADYIYQVNHLIGNYTYRQTLNNNPVVDRYELNGQQAYVLTVPDEKGRTAQYTLDLGNADSAKIYHPKAGSDTMDVEKVKLTAGQLTMTVTETPAFVLPVGAVSDSLKAMNLMYDPKKIMEKTSLSQQLVLYPNPTVGYVNVSYKTTSIERAVVKLYSSANAKIYRIMNGEANGEKVSARIELSEIPAGVYFVEVNQGNYRTVKKLVKIN